ncbi:MAG: hypothetical protein KJO50_02070 [Bacteroidia bacterium]|nr:hypothetical protein [Bacteroidia bacterium]
MEKKKIEKLFKYRQLPVMMQTMPKEERKALNKKLVKLQSAIYALDLYLESNWKLSDEALNNYWNEINSRMDELGVSADGRTKLTASIKRYQLHESQIRENKLPTRLDPEYYYYYKSCDVRLMRNLIYRFTPQLAKSESATDWRYYDLITEINDDIGDLYEDLDTINGNLFIIKIFEEGLEESVKFFSDFLDDILLKSIERFRSKSKEELRYISNLTFVRYVETKSLLNKMKNDIEKKGISSKKAMIKKLRKLKKSQ